MCGTPVGVAKTEEIVTNLRSLPLTISQEPRLEIGWRKAELELNQSELASNH